MQISYNTNSSFPSQVVPDAEKATLEYGLAVGRAIEGEWFRNYRGLGYRYATNFQNYHSTLFGREFHTLTMDRTRRCVDLHLPSTKTLF